MPEEEQKQIQVTADDTVLKGVYANGANVMFSPEEFIIDFMNVFPPKGVFTARVIMSPGHMKRLLMVLSENMKQYESQHGAISAAAEPEHKIGFRTE